MSLIVFCVGGSEGSIVPYVTTILLEVGSYRIVVGWLQNARVDTYIEH